MKTNIKYGLAVLAVLVVIGAPVYAVVHYYTTPGKYDDFAACIAESGAKFYGAFWCPHCQNQKAMFGKSGKLLPYEECSTPDTKGQMQVCVDAEVKSYPTWKFADGTTLTGEQSFQILADKTGCPVPADAPQVTAE